MLIVRNILYNIIIFFITEKSILIEIKTTVQGTNTANPEIFRHVELKEVNGSLYC